MRKIKNMKWLKDWLKRFLEKENNIEMFVSLSAQQVTQKLCLWGKEWYATADESSVFLENGQEVITTVLSKEDTAILMVAEQTEKGTKVYLSANDGKDAEKYLKYATDMLQHDIITIE